DERDFGAASWSDGGSAGAGLASRAAGRATHRGDAGEHGAFRCAGCEITVDGQGRFQAELSVAADAQGSWTDVGPGEPAWSGVAGYGGGAGSVQLRQGGSEGRPGLLCGDAILEEVVSPAISIAKGHTSASAAE